MALSVKSSLTLLAPVLILCAVGCSKSGGGGAQDAKAMNHLVLTNVEQRGDDTYADLQVRREWVVEGRSMPVEMPGGRTIQVVLNPVMKEGTYLRFKGQAFQGAGNLLLRVCIVK
jgi:hypothetical protein